MTIGSFLTGIKFYKLSAIYEEVLMDIDNNHQTISIVLGSYVSDIKYLIIFNGVTKKIILFITKQLF